MENQELKYWLQRCIDEFKDTLNYAKTHVQFKRIYRFAVNNKTHYGACYWLSNSKCNFWVDAMFNVKYHKYHNKAYIVNIQYKDIYAVKYNCINQICTYSNLTNKDKCQLVIELTNKRIKLLEELLTKIED